MMTREQYLKATETIEGGNMTGIKINKLVNDALERLKKLIPKYNWSASIKSLEGEGDVKMEIVLTSNSKEKGKAVYLVSSGEIEPKHYYKGMANDNPDNIIDWILDVFIFEELAK